MSTNSKEITENTILCLVSFIGNSSGYKHMGECMKDESIKQIIRNTVDELCSSVETVREPCQDNTDIAQYIEDLGKGQNIQKICTECLHSLGSKGGIVEATLKYRSQGKLPYYLAKAIAHAFLFQNDEDEFCKAVQNYIKKYGISSAVRKYCNLSKECDLIYLITRHYNRYLADKSISEDYRKVSIIKTAYEAGFAAERKYHGCAQCTLYGMYGITGKVDEALFRAASGLSGGIAQCGDGTCGAYTGAALFLGMFAGRRLKYFDHDKEEQYRLDAIIQKVHERFIQTYGTVICKEVHKAIFGQAYDLRDDEEKEQFKIAGGHDDKCTSVVGTAASWTAEILLEEKLLDPGDFKI